MLGLLAAACVVPATRASDARAPAATATATATPALLPTPQFRRFGMADGLPSSTINAVLQDRQGFLWFGGSGGLSRYDGVAFESWHHDPGDPASLSTNDITQLAAAPGGRLWVATGDAGLDRLDPATGRFEHWRHDPHDADSLASDVVYALAPAPDGSLWIGTGDGLDRLSPDGRHVRHVAYLQAFDGGANPKDKVVGALLAEPDGSLWIGTWSGVLLKRSPDGRLHRVPVQSGRPGSPDQIWRIEGGGDDVRIGTRFGLLRAGADGVARPVLAPAQLKPSYVFASARDAAGRLWMATLHGVVMLDTHGKTYAFHSQPLLVGGLPGEWTWRVIRDREGGLWFTFYDGGVAYLAPGWSEFSRYTHVPDDAGSLRGTVAELVVPSADGKLWVGSRGRLDKLDPATGRAQPVLDGLHSAIISLVDDGHGIWFTVRGQLAHRTGGKTVFIDPDHRRFSRPELLARGAGDTLYVTVARDGVLRIDTASMAMTPVPMPPGATDVDLRPGIIAWKDGALWYSDHEGLMRTDANGRLQFVPGVPRGEDVASLAFDPHGFWLDRGNVLEHYRLDGHRAERDRVVGVRQGWKAPVVNGMKVDAAGRLWIFSQAGLWRFDPGTGRLTQPGAQDGLAGSEFNGEPVAPGHGKTWYVPGESGVIGFVPGRTRRTGVKPPLVVEALGARNEHGVHGLDVARDGTVRLAWNDRDFRVGVRALSYVDPHANHYRFRLAGLDRGWVDTGNRGDREFVGLPAGDYTLDVMAAGADGVWSHLAVPLRIHVQSPPWLRWWAWLLYVVLAGLLACGALLAWRRRLAHRHRILLAEQRSSLAEQASAAKSQFLATLSHEIRTPMTGVMGMAELLLGTRQTMQQREYTEAMQRSGSLLLKLVNDALDLARIEVGKLELEPAPFDPRALAEDVVRLELAPAQAKGLALELLLDDALPTRLVGDAMRIKQVLFNLVNNALKFTEHGKVTLALGWQGDALMCTVADTGPGIPAESQARLFERFEQDDSPQRRSGSGLGLAICRELVALMHGTIALHSESGRGSTFSVRLPLPVAPTQAKRRVKVSAAAVSGRALDVLLVEDDAIVAAVVRGLLEQQGHHVRYAANGLQALAELEQGPCDAILLDLDLPGIDGLQIARLIRQRETAGWHAWIIAITARAGGDEEARSRAAGMDGFLRKPLTGAQLAEVLAAVPQASAGVT